MGRFLFLVSLNYYFRTMKKIFYILLFVPLFGFSQTQVDCSLLTVTDVIFQNDSITFEIFNADTVDSHYPYVAYTLDANGDTIQNGQMNYYMTFASTSSSFLYTHNLEFGSLNLPSIMYPLSIYFTYTNLTGENPGQYTCELIYNPQMDINDVEVNLSKIKVKTIDVLGRASEDVSNKILIDVYDDGSFQKRIIIE